VNQVEEVDLKCKELSENRIEEVKKVEKFISSAQKETWNLTLLPPSTY